MDRPLIIKNVLVVTDNQIVHSDVLIKKGHIDKIALEIQVPYATDLYDGQGNHLIPGWIDDQVHFREPGLTWKGDIYSESRAAVAGGITSFMEMPNTQPSAFTHSLLEDKYAIASQNSPANYSFYLGASSDNLEEIKRTNPQEVCGLKIFMGSSTGNLLVDDPAVLENIFTHSPVLIATHCEHEPSIRAAIQYYKETLGNTATAVHHPIVRNAEACILSSQQAIEIAKRTGARLHILHISTAAEVELFSASIPLKEKRITSEACVHHLWFTDQDYERLGNRIKWNPAIKSEADRAAIRQGLKRNNIDVIATDHAPHTLAEKSLGYWEAPSGGPLVQHGLPALLHMVNEGVFSLTEMVTKTSHAVAECFQIKDRGYLREGYKADMVLVNLKKPLSVNSNNLLYKCGWSPFEDFTFSASIASTWVNGNQVWDGQSLVAAPPGERLTFDRNA